MIELIFVACLAATPNECEERALVFVDVSTRTCVLGAQPQLAKWVNEHPNWKVSAWKCQSVDASSRRI